MEYLNVAANLNSRANQLLLNGDASSAFTQYRDAIRLLAECQKSAAEDDHVAQASSLLSAYTVAGQVSVQRKTLVAYQHEEQACSGSSFGSPLYEISLTKEDSVWTMTELALCSAVVIYNCAVCVHQRGGWAGLEKAHTLYAQCLELIQPTLSLAAPAHHNPLLASVLQNQANIFYNLNDFASVRCIMDKLFLLQQQDMIEKADLSTTSDIAPEA